LRAKQEPRLAEELVSPLDAVVNGGLRLFGALGVFPSFGHLSRLSPGRTLIQVNCSNALIYAGSKVST
jgi:hypothetical protein